MQKARERGGSARMVNTVGESTRQFVADWIKTEAALPDRGIPPSDCGKDRSV
jgi:cell filamentation protein